MLLLNLVPVIDPFRILLLLAVERRGEVVCRLIIRTLVTRRAYSYDCH